MLSLFRITSIIIGLFQARVSVTETRNGKIRTTLKTNQIAGIRYRAIVEKKNINIVINRKLQLLLFLRWDAFLNVFGEKTHFMHIKIFETVYEKAVTKLTERGDMFSRNEQLAIDKFKSCHLRVVSD